MVKKIVSKTSTHMKLRAALLSYYLELFLRCLWCFFESLENHNQDKAMVYHNILVIFELQHFLASGIKRVTEAW
ncbi:hypothetical protein L6452_31197 [Arctium lappa]|uniref:Uncharacterized protein n=1 Tax=Arctium lappa TaxID=4217 RepID=A0ACB8ZL84_ARCLA|nr:hypothetical protein L6452_31197 [Arctium lappa]